MIKVSVLYGNAPGATFDMTYYESQHMPMVRERMGTALKGMQIDQGLGGVEPGSAPAFLTLAHLVFESVGAFETAFAPHAEEILGDLPNFTNVQPTVQISDVRMA